MNARVTLKEGMSFTGTADSGFKVELGASPVVGGSSSGFRPMELVLVSLAGCTAMDVISILRKKRQEVSHFEVKIEAQRALEHPKVFTEILLTYIVGGNGVDEAAVERSIELSLTKYCPVHAMLSPTVEIRHAYEISDAYPLSGD
ncbi:MAG TPA: OsmC family protein [Candidatus Binatia bacterium]|jgi:putative redox protein|nr:OsmC family protein [Candidatus Binatia bacterium]